MFCPDIKGECVGVNCRDWDTKGGKCLVEKEGNLREAIAIFQKQGKEMENFISTLLENEKYSRLFNKLTVTRMLSDPTLDPEMKEVINEAFHAPSSDVAGKLLKDAGLID